jgi:putative toxin-antitoxin system antitoxin component (TIGR02293 family)
MDGDTNFVSWPAIGDSFAALLSELGTQRRSPVEAIRRGFPAGMLNDASICFGVPASRIRTIAHLPETSADALAKHGHSLDPAASERLWRLADLLTMANEVFEDSEAAKIWLRTPNRTFSNDAPMDYLDTEPGAIAVRQVLNAIATGGAI